MSHKPPYDEELNYQATPGWKAPEENKANPLPALWHKFREKRPLITRPVTAGSLCWDVGRLTVKTIAYTAVLTSPISVPLVIDHHNGFFSSNYYTLKAQGKILAKQTTETPPAVGPIDIERCYNRVAGWREDFARNGDVVTPQMPWTQHTLLPSLGSLFDGIPVPPVFDRPMQTGPVFVDAMGKEMSQHKTPYRIYNKFDDIPLVIAKGLAYVEDRPIIDPTKDPHYNAAINIPRFIKSILEYGEKKVGLRSNAAGGSGLKVQSFKNQAYPDGQTGSIVNKLTQMDGASISLYDKGKDTRENRLEAITEYMNMTASFGRYRGFNDGMAIWFGNDTFNEVLKADPELKTERAALAFRQAMTLAMAVREPSRVLFSAKGFNDAQARMNDTFIPKWVEEGVITPEAGKRVAAIKLDHADVGKNPIRAVYPQPDKAVQALKLALTAKLKIPGEDSQYILNSCHLRVESPLYGDLNVNTVQKFDNANEPEKAKSMGLTGTKYQLNASQTTPFDVKRAVTISQIMPDGRLLTRISAHNFDGEFDPNRFGYFNTGSTNKAVMAATLLQIGLTELYYEYEKSTPEQLAQAKTEAKDKLTNWALDYLSDPTKEKSLAAMLDAFDTKDYLTTRACFFTGQGMNCPQNFENKNYGTMSFKSVIATSNNLGSYRFTDDLEEHVKWHKLKIDPRIFDAAETDPAVLAKRKTYTTRFALDEGAVFQSRAFVAIKKSPEITTARLAADYFAGTTTPDFAGLQKHLQDNCKTDEACITDEKKLSALYEAHKPSRDIMPAALLAAPLDKSPTTLMQVYRDVAPAATYTQARDFVRVQADFTPQFNAAAPDTSTDKTHELAERLTSLPRPETGPSLASQLVALYGERHPGANIAQTMLFVARHCIPCLKEATTKDLHEKYVANGPGANSLTTLIASRLTSGSDYSAQTLMSTYRALKPKADYAEVREFTDKLVEFRAEAAAVKTDTSLAFTHQLAEQLISLPQAKGAAPLAEQLVALYGSRHTNASRAETLGFVAAHTASTLGDVKFKQLHQRYVAADVTDTSPLEIARLLAKRTSRQPTALAVTLFSVWPDATFDNMSDFLTSECTGRSACDLSPKKLTELYEVHAPRKMVPLESLLISNSERTPQTIMDLHRQLNPATTYGDSRRFVSEVLPDFSPFTDLSKEFGAVKADPSREMTDKLAKLISRTPKPTDPDAARNWYSPEEQLAALYGKRHPGAEYAETKSFILKHCPECTKWADYKDLHQRYAAGPAYDTQARHYRFSLDDRQYLSRVHPMWLEVGRMIGKDPKVTLEQTLDQTKDLRVAIYTKWLIEPKKLTPGKIKAQIKAAGIMADKDAWAEINKFWALLGYKRTLKDTLANVISAAHSTEDLTNFNAVLLNGGKTVTSSSFLGIHIAEGTPHEMHQKMSVPPSTQVMDPVTAAHTIKLLRNGVESPEGTSRRLFGAFKREDGTPYVVFGKTGTSADASTGDFRGAFWTGGIGGCFAVTIGTYKFGAGPSDRFTSADPTQMLKNLAPEIEEMFKRFPCANDASKEIPVKAVPGEKKAEGETPGLTTPVTMQFNQTWPYPTLMTGLPAPFNLPAPQRPVEARPPRLTPANPAGRAINPQ